MAGGFVSSIAKAACLITEVPYSPEKVFEEAVSSQQSQVVPAEASDQSRLAVIIVDNLPGKRREEKSREHKWFSFSLFSRSSNPTFRLLESRS